MVALLLLHLGLLLLILIPLLLLGRAVLHLLTRALKLLLPLVSLTQEPVKVSTLLPWVVLTVLLGELVKLNPTNPMWVHLLLIQEPTTLLAAFPTLLTLQQVLKISLLPHPEVTIPLKESPEILTALRHLRDPLYVR